MLLTLAELSLPLSPRITALNFPFFCCSYLTSNQVDCPWNGAGTYSILSDLQYVQINFSLFIIDRPCILYF